MDLNFKLKKIMFHMFENGIFFLVQYSIDAEVSCLLDHAILTGGVGRWGVGMGW